MTDRSDCEIDLKEQIHRLTKVTIETVDIDGQPNVYAEGPFIYNNKQQLELCDRTGLWSVSLRNSLRNRLPIPGKYFSREVAKLQICVGGDPISAPNANWLIKHGCHPVPVGSRPPEDFRVMDEYGRKYGKFQITIRCKNWQTLEVGCFIGPFKSYDGYDRFRLQYLHSLGSVYPHLSVLFHDAGLPLDMVSGTISACCYRSKSINNQDRHEYKKEWPFVFKSDA